MNANNYHVVIVITGEKILKEKNSFQLIVELEELFYAHYLLASFIDSSEHETNGTSKVIHLNRLQSKDQLELDKHLKLSDLLICIGLNEKQSQSVRNYFKLTPSDCSVFEINDEESFLDLEVEQVLLNTSFTESIKDMIHILKD